MGTGLSLSTAGCCMQPSQLIEQKDIYANKYICTYLEIFLYVNILKVQSIVGWLQGRNNMAEEAEREKGGAMKKNRPQFMSQLKFSFFKLWESGILSQEQEAD